MCVELLLLRFAHLCGAVRAQLYTTWLKLSDAEQRRFVASLDAASAKYFAETGAKAKGIHERNAHKASWPINL